MKVEEREVKSVLTEQKNGFLATAPYPYTHTLSAYTGCGFGKTSCGTYCYAQFMPNWIHFAQEGTGWGGLVSAKTNAPQVLEQTLSGFSLSKRSSLRIFMSSTTDPYQPLEAKYQLTQHCLKIFQQFTDLDLLVIQTRSPLAMRDLELMRQIQYAWLSVTIETDQQAILTRMGGGSLLTKRFELIQQAAALGMPCQIVISPCLPYTPAFADILVNSGARRIVVDNFVAGDGSGGNRTARSPLGKENWFDWRDEQPSLTLFNILKARGTDVSWSAEGFCGIPPRQRLPSAAQPEQLKLL